MCVYLNMSGVCSLAYVIHLLSYMCSIYTVESGKEPVLPSQLPGCFCFCRAQDVNLQLGPIFRLLCPGVKKESHMAGQEGGRNPHTTPAFTEAQGAFRWTRISKFTAVRPSPCGLCGPLVGVSKPKSEGGSGGGRRRQREAA